MVRAVETCNSGRVILRASFVEVRDVHELDAHVTLSKGESANLPLSKPLYALASTRRNRVSFLLVKRLTQPPPHCSVATASFVSSSAATPQPTVYIDMSSTPSSRRRGHSSRKSQSSTPVQPPPSSPRGSRQSNGGPAPSSSPILYQSSSPTKGTPKQPQRSIDELMVSSPPRQPSLAGDRETTPRASRQPAFGGKQIQYDLGPRLMYVRIVSCSL